MTNRTEMNRQARAIIARDAENGIITSCELRFPGCMGTFGIAPAHKRPRIFYRTVEELSDFKNYVWACVHCHQILDDRTKTSREQNDELFAQLRPE